MKTEIRQIRAAVRDARALIHCITNPISINQCANAILAVGARPIMAEHPREVAEITRTAGSLMLNLGNITDVRMASMKIAAQTAAAAGVPVTLDMVGISCSTMRRQYVLELLRDTPFTLLKGNYSEILSLAEESYRSSGIDAEQGLSLVSTIKAAVRLSLEYGCMVLASGEADIVTDGKRTFLLRNGTPQLAAITGTGCLLGALCAAYLSADQTVNALITACSVLGIAGEQAETPLGNGTFFVRLMDQLSVLSDEAIEQKIQLEEVSDEL